jgi:hypothetical protein
MERSRHRVEKGLWIWRGAGRLPARVDRIGDTVSEGETHLTPVRYTSGKHGIVNTGPLMTVFGLRLCPPRELRPKHNEECYDVIRASSAMPEIAMITHDGIKIRVSDVGTVWIKRHERSIIAERVEALA